MIKITDNTNKKVYFGDLKKGDFIKHDISRKKS